MPDQPEKGPQFVQQQQQIRSLSKQFGGLSKIPDDALTEMGYVRKTSEDGLVSVTPLQVQEQRKIKAEEDAKQKEENLKKKTENVPFGRIAVPFEGGSTMIRFINEEQTVMVLKKVEVLSESGNVDVFEYVDDLVPSASPYKTFGKDYIDFAQTDKNFTDLELGEDSDFDEMHYYASFIDMVADPYYRVQERLGINLKPGDFYGTMNDEGERILTASDATQLFTDYERLRGTLDDPELKEIEPHFNEETKDPKDQALGYKTRLDIARSNFATYLEKRLGLEDIAAQIRDAQTAQAILDSIQNADFATDLKKDEKELRARLNVAPVEEKRVMSKLLSELQAEIKKMTLVRLGMIDFFTLDTPINYFKSKVKEVQDFLIAKNTLAGGSEYTLDATPDEKLDADPGQISGDCTAGTPLPFDRSDISLYNVKVFSPGNEHVGNIYLLETTEEGTDIPVWHLEALQIPIRVNWNESFGVLIDKMGEEAQKKGVFAITINEEAHHISNYDYIQNAALQFCNEKTAGKIIPVKIPSGYGESESVIPADGTKYSRFQSFGVARIVWENPDLQAA